MSILVFGPEVGPVDNLNKPLSPQYSRNNHRTLQNQLPPFPYVFQYLQSTKNKSIIWNIQKCCKVQPKSRPPHKKKKELASTFSTFKSSNCHNDLLQLQREKESNIISCDSNSFGFYCNKQV